MKLEQRSFHGSRQASTVQLPAAPENLVEELARTKEYVVKLQAGLIKADQRLTQLRDDLAHAK